MNVPAIVTQTFQRAPFARKLAFHRNREMMWKPEVEMWVAEHQRSIPVVTPPLPQLVRDAFAPLPKDWVGSVYFEWQPETGWIVTAPIREEFMRDVCSFLNTPVVNGTDVVIWQKKIDF